MPNYVTQTSISMGVAGPMHRPTFYRDSGVSLHPFQRAGLVGAQAHTQGLGAQAVAHGLPGGDIGQGRYPAARVDMVLPPVVPFTTNPNQGKFQV